MKIITVMGEGGGLLIFLKVGSPHMLAANF